MKRKLWLLSLIPAVFMAVSVGRAYAQDELDAYLNTLEYGLLGLIEYFEFIIALYGAI